MKAIKRLIPLLLIGLLAVGAMSGCTRRKPENTTTPTPTPTVAPASRAPEDNPVAEETPGPTDGEDSPSASPIGSMDPSASPVGSMDPSASPVNTDNP